MNEAASERTGSRGWVAARFLPVMLAAAALALGCSDSEIKTYRVAKEDHALPAVPAGGPQAHGHTPALPHLHWKLPAGWKELPADKMRVGSFQIEGTEGKTAQVSIIPLPGAGKIELQSVNMWREELQLPGLQSQELDTLKQAVAVGDFGAGLFEMAGTKLGEKSSSRTLGVIGERNGIPWFIKMTGADSLVAEQKPAFVQFLKTIEFHDQAHGAVASAEKPAEKPVQKQPEAPAPVAQSTEKPAAPSEGQGKLPANWTSKPPGPMVQSAYSVRSAAGGQAEVTISKFPGDVGGMVANINRWRGQLGLPPQSDAEVRSSAKMIEVNGKADAYLVDLKGTNVRTGQPARMVAIGVPRGGETWFYKLMGEEPVVEAEKEVFVKHASGPN